MDLFFNRIVVCTLSGIACFWTFHLKHRLVREDLKKKGETSYVHSIICS